MNEIKPFAFVLMPFAEKFKDIYKYGIKGTATELNIVAERVDEQHFSESVLERIYRQIEQSDFIIADMTGQNPNVFYEVGYAHAKSKICILITSDASDIPFDLKHQYHVVYDGTIDDLKSKLIPKMEWAKEECLKRKQKTITLSIAPSDGLIENQDWRHIGTFTLTTNLKNLTEQKSPEIEAIYITTTSNWKLSVSGTECASNPADGKTGLTRHLLAPPIKRLAPNAFAQIKINFEKQLWSKYEDDNIKQEEYDIKGNIRFEIETSEGTFEEEKAIAINFTEFPF